VQSTEDYRVSLTLIGLVMTVKKTGAPSNAKKKALSKGNRGAVGRPKGDAAVINEYKTRMLASPKSRKVLDSIMDAAYYL